MKSELLQKLSEIVGPEHYSETEAETIINLSNEAAPILGMRSDNAMVLISLGVQLQRYWNSKKE